MCRRFNAQDIYVDGNRIGEIGAAVLRDRKDLSEDGVVLAVAAVDFESKDDLASPRYSSAVALSTCANQVTSSAKTSASSSMPFAL